MKQTECLRRPKRSAAMIAVASLAVLSRGVGGFSAPLPLMCPAASLPSHLSIKHREGTSCPRAMSSRRPTSSWRVFSTPEDEGEADAENEEAPPTEIVAESLTSSQIESLRKTPPFLSNLKNIFTNGTKFNRESLGKLGMSALLAYGFVSNVSGVIAVSCAWFIFSKRTGLSPLGNKPAFLALYAGFTVALNVIRPARFALSMAISPYFERIRSYFQRKFGVSPRGAAVLMVVFINFIGTCSLMALGVGMASALSGVPIWASVR